MHAVGRLTLDVRRRASDVGRWTLDVGGPGRWTSGWWTLDVGQWMGVGRCTLHVGRRTLHGRSDVGRLNDGRLRTLDVRGWTLKVGRRALNVRRWTLYVQTFERWTLGVGGFDDGRADIGRWTLKVWRRASTLNVGR